MSVLEVSLDGAVAVLKMNRPERRNALSPELVRALSEALWEADEDPQVRAVLLTGAGKVFCAGGDLAGGMQGADEGLVRAEHHRGGFGRLLGQLPKLGVPVVAAVHGDALGGGLGIVAACDLVVVDPAARLGTPEVRIGLFPHVIAAALQRVVPRRALMELVLLGERVSAERAVELGLANRVSAPGEAVSEGLALAHQLAERSAATLALGKRGFYLAADLPFDQALEVLNGRLTLNMMLEDAGEGVAAFLQKRAPEWNHR